MQDAQKQGNLVDGPWRLTGNGYSHGGPHVINKMC